MRPRLLAQLVHTPDLDYVEHFQMLAAVNLEIRRSGPTAERLLRKAILEMDVGNFLASLSAAEDALALDPKSPEIRHQLGRINLRLALAKAGIIPLGPGAEKGILQSPTELLQAAIRAFEAAVRLNPQDDESRADAGILVQLTSDCDSDAKLTRALRRDAA
jgi:tetratricopeptide (TPR) repeat protein